MMEWKDIADKVARSAPLLGTVLAGPAGGAVGALIATALGTEPVPSAVGLALQADPAAYAKVKEVELGSKVELQRLVVQSEGQRLAAEAAQYAAEAADRASARDLAAKTPRDLIRPMLAVCMLIGSGLIAMAVVLGWAENIMKDATASLTLGTVIGYWFSEMKQVMGFYFGMTKEAQTQSRAITEFAVAPGTVTKPEK